MGGKLVLLNSFLSAMPTYLISMFILPNWVRERFDKIRRRFLQKGLSRPQKGYYLVEWGQVCQPKDHGGLGVKHLRTMNLALITKWWWSLLAHPNETLQQLLRTVWAAKRFTVDKLKNITSVFTFQKDVRSISPCANNHGVRYKTSRNLEVTFWHNDRWCLENPPSSIFPSLYEIALEKDVFVGDY